MKFSISDLTDTESQALGYGDEVKRGGVPLDAAVNEDRSIFLIYRGSPMPEVRDYMVMVLVWEDGQKIGIDCDWGTDQRIDGVRYREVKILQMITPANLEPLRPAILDVLKDSIYVLMGMEGRWDVLSVTDLSKGN